MKRNKGIFNGAVVLLIAAFMVMSTMPAIADTEPGDWLPRPGELNETYILEVEDTAALSSDPDHVVIADPFFGGGPVKRERTNTFSDKAVLVTEDFSAAWVPATNNQAPPGWDQVGIATGTQVGYPDLTHYFSRFDDAYFVGAYGFSFAQSPPYSAGIWWSSDEAQDEYLISPELDLTDYVDTEMVFRAMYTMASYGASSTNHIYIKASTDGGLNWDILGDLPHDPQFDFPGATGGPLGPGWNYYENDLVIDLSGYDGESSVYVAINYQYEGTPPAGIFACDDVVIEATFEGPPPGGCDFEVVEILFDPEENSDDKHIEVKIRNNGPEPILEVKKLVSIEEEVPGVTSEVFNDGFEGALTDWITTDNGDMDTFTLSSTRVRSGNYSMRCTAGIDRPDAVQDTYLGHAADSGPDELIMVSPVDFTGADEGFISFWHYCSGEYYVDGGYVYPTDYGLIALDWGLGWFTINPSYFIAYNNGWEQVVLDLVDMGVPLTSTVAIKFMWDSDPHMEYEGWYIDDVVFSRTEPPTYKLIDQMWSIQNLSDFEERVEIFELPWTEMEECHTYKICVQGQVFDPIDCEIDLENNELCTFVHIYDCEDLAVNSITGADRIEKCNNETYVVNITNTGTYDITDGEVFLEVARLVESELFFDDFESGLGNWQVWSWNDGPGPGVTPHLTDFGAYSGTNSLAFFDDSDNGYPNVVDLQDARAITGATFDFTSEDNRGGYLSFYANWASLAGDAWRVQIYDPISNYVLGWYGTIGVNGDFYGPSNPNGYPELYTYDLKEQIDYWYGVYGAYGTVAPIGMFSNPDGSINYECGVGFYLEADDDGCTYPPGEFWSGLMVDDVRVYERYCDSTGEVKANATVDFLEIGDSTEVELEWHGDQYCNWCITAFVPDDCNNSNNEARMEVRVSTTLDDMPTDEAGEDPWDHDDLTDISGSNWHVVSKHENFAGEPATDQYFWNGDDALGKYLPNTDDVLVSETFSLDGAARGIVTFDTYFEFEAGDRGEVAYSSDGGVHWNLLATFGGSGYEFEHWHVVSYTIPEEGCTDTMKLRFRMISDNLYEANGWYVDDIDVSPLYLDTVLIDGEDFEMWPGWNVIDIDDVFDGYYGTWNYYSSYGGVARCYYDYGVTTESMLVSPEIDITTFSDYDLLFDSYMYGSYVTGTVEISTNGGADWDVLETITYPPSGWTAKAVDLSNYTGNVMIGFRCVITGSYSYWMIDDIQIGGITVVEGTAHYPLEDFEGGNGGYTVTTTGSTADWAYGAPTVYPPGANSPVNCWTTGIDTTYSNYDYTTLESVAITIPGTAVSPFLTFYHWMDAENGYDGGNVRVSNNGGASFTTIFPEGGYPDTYVSGIMDDGYTGTIPWTEAFFDLSAYIGDTIIIQWQFGADSIIDGYAGWAIDDVRVQEISVVTNFVLDFDCSMTTFPPAGWTHIQTDFNTWKFSRYRYASIGITGAECWWSYNPQDEYLLSPVFSVTGGSIAEVTYDSWWHGYDYSGSAMTDYKYVITTEDGTSWNLVYDINDYSNGPTPEFKKAPGFSFSGPACQFGFNLWWTDDIGNRGIWIIDNLTATSFNPGTSVFFENVENVTGPFGTWTGSVTPGGDWWHLTNARAYTGSVSWWCGDDLIGAYPTDGPGLNDVLYADFDLAGIPSAPFFSADLEFMHWGNFGPGAQAFVELSGDGGLTWNTMWVEPHPDSDPTNDPDSIWDWEKLTFNLDEYVGGTVTVRFRFTAPGDGAPNAEGWYIDDIVIHYKEVIYEDETPPITSICLTNNEISMFAYDPNVPPAPTSGVANTYYELDGGSQQTYSGPFTITLDEDHTIVYWSVDIAGNEESHKTFTYEAPDDTPPTISIDMPDGLYIMGNKIMDRIFGEGILAIGKLPVAATASDDVGVTMVTFEINGETAFANTPPYETMFNERHFGALSVTATAYDAAGNSASATKDDITVYCLGIL